MQGIDLTDIDQHAARTGLEAVEALRVAVNSSLQGGEKISRAEIARFGGLSDATLARGLKGGVASRMVTTARAAGGLLAAIVERKRVNVDAELYEIDKQVLKAAAELAHAVLYCESGLERDQRTFALALGKLDQVMDHLQAAHHRLPAALRHLAHAHLEDESRAVRLALVGAASAVLERASLELWGRSSADAAA